MSARPHNRGCGRHLVSSRPAAPAPARRPLFPTAPQQATSSPFPRKPPLIQFISPRALIPGSPAAPAGRSPPVVRPWGGWNGRLRAYPIPGVRGDRRPPGVPQPRWGLTAPVGSHSPAPSRTTGPGRVGAGGPGRGSGRERWRPGPLPRPRTRLLLPPLLNAAHLGHSRYWPEGRQAELHEPFAAVLCK